MLHLVDVPKGTKFVGVSTRAVRFKPMGATTFTQRFEHSSCLFFPCFGSPAPSSKDVDCGWIANYGDHNGQKDVEHLDLDGDILPKHIVGAWGPKNPGSPYASCFASEWFSIPGKISSTYMDQWFSHTCAYGSLVVSCKDTVGEMEGAAVGVHPWRNFVVLGWAASNVCFSGSTYRQMDIQSTCMISTSCWKFSADFKDMVSWSMTINLAGSSPLLTGDDYAEEISKAVFAQSVTKTPVAGAALTNWETTRVLNNYDVPDFKLLDRSEVFQGELNPIWGDLVYDCYSQVKLWNGNGLAYGRDLVTLTTAFRSLLSLAKSIRNVKNVKEATKSLADLFLSMRYGWNLTAKDTLSLLELDYERAYPQGNCKRSSSYTYFRNGNTIEARASVYCRPYSDCISELADLLRSVDLDLSLENIWDLIPYSFVIDWFANVGGVLDRMDKWGEMDKYHIFLTGRTLKATTSRGVDKIPHLTSMVGNVQARYYKRDYTTDVIPPSLSSSRTVDQKFNHWIEGTALAIQRVR